MHREWFIERNFDMEQIQLRPSTSEAGALAAISTRAFHSDTACGVRRRRPARLQFAAVAKLYDGASRCVLEHCAREVLIGGDCLSTTAGANMKSWAHL